MYVCKPSSYRLTSRHFLNRADIAPMARKTKEDAQETRTLIMDTAEQVFREKGVGHTTLAEIATAAGLTRGAIYWHFENKSALLQAVNDRVHLPLEAMHQSLADAGLADPLAQLHESARNVLTQIASDARSRRVFEIFSFKCEYVGEMAEMFLRQKQSRQECLRDLADNLRHAVERGQVRAEVDVERTAIGLYALVDGLIKNWLMAPEEFDLVAVGMSQVEALCASLRREM